MLPSQILRSYKREIKIKSKHVFNEIGIQVVYSNVCIYYIVLFTEGRNYEGFDG
jgi:hypothetical protein